MKFNKNKYPLFTVWNILGTFGAIMSLSSLAENIVSWQGFVLNTIVFYQGIIHPLFNFLVGWLPFDIPTGVYDYIVIGLIIAICNYKAMNKFYDSVYAKDYEFITNIIVLPTIVWPVFLLKLLLQLGPHKKRFGSRLDKKFNLYVVQLMGLILLGLVFLFSINQLIN